MVFIQIAKPHVSDFVLEHILCETTGRVRALPGPWALLAQALITHRDIACDCVAHALRNWRSAPGGPLAQRGDMISRFPARLVERHPRSGRCET